jgi:hypothetical protein
MACYRATFQSKKSPEGEVRFVPADAGTSVTYDADLRWKGKLGRLLDPLLGLALRRLGHRAAIGLGKALNL